MASNDWDGGTIVHCYQPVTWANRIHVLVEEVATEDDVGAEVLDDMEPNPVGSAAESNSELDSAGDDDAVVTRVANVGAVDKWLHLVS